MKIIDNALSEDMRKRIHEMLLQPGWEWGWKSDTRNDVYSFWHKHFVGYKRPEHEQEVVEDLSRALMPPLSNFWTALKGKILPTYALERCYANAYPFGVDGTVHTDSEKAGSVTAIYYPHGKWEPNWGGETLFFNAERSDVIGCVYPKPNRLLIFDGRIPHVARAVSRTCPQLRVTLMFKARNGLASKQKASVTADESSQITSRVLIDSL